MYHVKISELFKKLTFICRPMAFGFYNFPYDRTHSSPNQTSPPRQSNTSRMIRHLGSNPPKGASCCIFFLFHISACISLGNTHHQPTHTNPLNFVQTKTQLFLRRDLRFRHRPRLPQHVGWYLRGRRSRLRGSHVFP